MPDADYLRNASSQIRVSGFRSPEQPQRQLIERQVPSVSTYVPYQNQLLCENYALHSSANFLFPRLFLFWDGIGIRARVFSANGRAVFRVQ